MKKFQSINESMFSNSVVSSKGMSAILGGFAPDPNETGAGSACLPDGRCQNWTSDYKREDGLCNRSGITYTSNPC